MKNLPTRFYTLLLLLALVLGLIAAFLYFMEATTPIGPFVISAFIALAIGILGFPKVSSLSYTLWIFAAVSVSMFYPSVFLKVGDFELSILIVPLLQLIMFGMGTTMSLDDFAGVIKMPKGVLVGVICQFTIMPIVGTGLAYSFGFPPEIAAGLILVGSSPSGLASNVMAFIAKANVALSVTLTAVATLLAPLMTPLLMKYLAGQFVPIDFWGMMSSIIKIVIIPIAAGLLFNRLMKKPFGWQQGLRIGTTIALGLGLIIGAIILDRFLQPMFTSVSLLFELFWIGMLTAGIAIILQKTVKDQSFVDRLMPLISMVGIAVIIAIITAAGRDSLLQVGGLLVLACLIHNCSGYVLGYMGCKMVGLDKKSCRTIALEVGLQNGGLASGIAKEMGRLATVGLAPAIFGPMMNITGSSLASWWRGRATEEEDVPTK